MSYAIQFVMCYLLWVMLTWPFKVGIGGLLAALGALVLHNQRQEVLAAGAGQEFVAGILVAGLAAALFGCAFPRHASRLLSPARYMWFAVYLFMAAAACLAACLDVAYRLLHIRLPIRPAIVKVRTGLKSEMGRLVLAHTVALLPGTMVIDMVGQDMYVHWSNVSTGSAQLRSELILGQFEGLLKKVFE